MQDKGESNHEEAMPHLCSVLIESRGQAENDVII
jgi:hypothetical protein